MIGSVQTVVRIINVGQYDDESRARMHASAPAVYRSN